ncbi:enoyl-CoA hydratase/isomerase family protein [Amycolatopsis sp.]|uniref:enoyl-CoA hydratase/isomerase family protein n=1 Tax=Amycolatopsis sp. TaxID=37632 RepID=UPI00261888B0|nr:enoyl-CoA hydratase/isomerase family protein [Amycolatopsis sp.]
MLADRTDAGSRRSDIHLMYDDYDNFLVKADGPILEVIINRPAARNAITYALEEELERLLNTAADDDAIRVVTLRGAGKLFSAGHDLKEVAAKYVAGGPPPHKVPHLRAMWYFPKPIIAGVHEYVGPIAQDIVAHCDFVIAVEGTKFSFEQARMGAGVIAYSPLVFQLPMRVYKKLMMAGGWYTAEQALKWDFVQRVVPADELDTVVRAWADELALVPPQQTKAAKLGIHRQYELMGLANMALVQNALSGHGSADDKKFFATVMESGLRKALEFRQTNSDESISQV